MYALTKSQAMFLATEEGYSKLKKENLEFKYVPMVGFTYQEFGWHDNEKNKFYFSFSNPKIAYFIAYWMGELNVLLNPHSGEGIFHKVIAIKKGEKIDKKIYFSEMGVQC